MKKSYTKPEIMFEDFSISTNIAAGCEKVTTNPVVWECGLKMSSNAVVFVSTVHDCTMPIENGEMNDGLCYHVPSQDNNLFNS